MQHHGAASPKRTVFWSNLRTADGLDKGKLRHEERVKKTKVKTTRNASKVGNLSGAEVSIRIRLANVAFKASKMRYVAPRS